MDSKLLNLALFEVVVSLITGVVILYMTYKFVKRVFGLTPDALNTAFGIVVGAILFSVGLIVSSVIPPLLSTLRMLPGDFFVLLAKLSMYLVIFFVISTVIAYATNAIGIWLFTRLTRIDELEELRRNNVATALVTAAIVIVLALFVKDGVVLLLESIVPYPEMPSVR